MKSTSSRVEWRCCAGHTAQAIRRYILSSGNVRGHSSVTKNKADLKQHIHLDNPYNRKKNCAETLRPYQSKPNLQQRNPYYGGPKRTLHGDFDTQTVNSSSQGQKLAVSSIAVEARAKDSKIKHI